MNKLSNLHKDSVLLMSNIHADGAPAASVTWQLTVKRRVFSGGWSVASEAFPVFEGRVVGLLASLLRSVFKKLKQTDQSISLTSGARPPPPPTPPFDTGWLFIRSTSFKCMFTEGRKADKFPRPSLATGVCGFYWTSEMVRGWSCDTPGQWNVVGGKMDLGE